MGRMTLAFMAGLLLVVACANPMVPTATTPTTPTVPTPTTPTAPTPTTPTTPTSPTIPTPPAVRGLYDILIPGREFSPSTLIVPVGAKVTWFNRDGEQHTVTSDSNPKLFNGPINPGGSFSYIFTQSGNFSYYCEPHSDQMSGVIIVK
jgi:plastocyanin